MVDLVRVSDQKRAINVLSLEQNLPSKPQIRWLSPLHLDITYDAQSQVDFRAIKAAGIEFPFVLQSAQQGDENPRHPQRHSKTLSPMAGAKSASPERRWRMPTIFWPRAPISSISARRLPSRCCAGRSRNRDRAPFGASADAARHRRFALHRFLSAAGAGAGRWSREWIISMTFTAFPIRRSILRWPLPPPN